MIFFVHIPKTAGTSLQESFKVLAGSSLLWYAQETDLSNRIAKAPTEILADPETRKKFKVYGGHYGFHQLEPYLQEDDVVVTVLREPVSRAFSFYNHVIVNDRRHPLRPVVLGKTVIQAAIANQAFQGQIDNMQCWHLSGQRVFAPAHKVIEEGRVLAYDVSEAQSLLQLVAERLGAKEVPILPSLNLSRKEGYLEEMTQEEIGFLRALTIHDQHLYDYVLSRATVTS